MIDENEVRQGNYFYDVYGNIGQAIIGLGCFEVHSRKSNSKLHDGCKPIPLTPEILEKCGFVKMESGYWKNNTIRLMPESKGTYLLYGHPSNEIKYLHQLQNLYFALTGTELEINL